MPAQHSFTRISLNPLESSCLLHSQREGLFDVWNMILWKEDWIHLFNKSFQVSVSLRHLGKHSPRLPLYMLNARRLESGDTVWILALLPAVCLCSDLHSLPIVMQPQLVTIVISVNVVRGAETEYLTMLYSLWKIATSLAFVNTLKKGGGGVNWVNQWSHMR